MNQDHFERRDAQMQARLRELNLAAAVLMQPRNMFYVTGWNAVIYSRPQYVVIQPQGEAVLILPRVREKRARLSARVRNIQAYHESEALEEKRDPIRLLAANLRGKSSGRKRIGIEESFMPINIYRLLIQSLGDCETVDISAELQHLRMFKDENEVKDIRKAAILSEVGMQAAADAIKSGGTEIDINVAAEKAMLDAWSDRYPRDDIVGFGDDAGGVTSALWCFTRAGAHICVTLPASTHDEIPHGEAVLVVITTTVNGYVAEFERTFFKGRPSGDRRAAYQAVMRARDRLRSSIRPGAVCQELVRLVGEAMSETGFTYGSGFVGHGIGLGNHEHPHIVPGDTTPIKAGMVLALEPGTVLSDFGVRHSDTVLVTEDGCVSLTPWDRFTEVEL